MIEFTHEQQIRVKYYLIKSEKDPGWHNGTPELALNITETLSKIVPMFIEYKLKYGLEVTKQCVLICTRYLCNKISGIY